ncbi:unnamed protein product [Schistocephalus solidus]|uniref:CMP/dCMP-type deaminase domain-containing protein n=1 Tax=Schistocephalus solidus TaxID=70667 RepID=A0A183SQ58_SCHSO|nr:unnamed protein product [Schistocephalus solidus]
METAFDLAKEALAANEVPIGCSFVYNGKVNEYRNASLHAEILAIMELEQWCASQNLDFAEVLSQSILYVTAEPCIMIVYSAKNERFGGCGSVLSIHSDPSPYPILVCEVDNRSDESIDLLKQFYKLENANAPESKRIKKRQ